MIFRKKTLEKNYNNNYCNVFFVTNKGPRKAQVIIEFSFCMIVLLLMLYSTMMIFHWSGIDLVGRRIAYDNSLFLPVSQDYSVSYDGTFFGLNPDSEMTWVPNGGTIKQLEPNFYTPTLMNAIFRDK